MKEGGKTYMDQQQMESINRIALFIRALNHPLRQEILALLDENKDNTKKLIVNDIRKNVRQEQSVVSQHLAILLRVGLVTKKRQGKSFYYKLNLEKLELANQLIELFTLKPTPLGKSKDEKGNIL